MRRLLIIFLLGLLPVQFAWSAAAVYCAHEPASIQGSHFGHHLHVHKSEPTSSSKLVADTDCASCHAASAPIIVSDTDSPPVAPSTAAADRRIQPAISSPPARVPDRPQWLRLV